jgi:hypothetical protein
MTECAHCIRAGRGDASPVVPEVAFFRDEHAFTAHEDGGACLGLEDAGGDDLS